MAIAFAAATQGDAEALVRLRIVAMRESLERIGRFEPERARERFLLTFQPQHTRHVLVDGERAGFVVVKPADDGLLLDHLYIDPRYQNRGVGSRVLEIVFAEADAQGVSLQGAALRGSDSNRFYLRHGFALVREDVWDNYYVRPARPAG